MEGLQSLLLIYAIATLISALISFAVWRERRDPLTRSQFLLWAGTLFALVVQGAFSKSLLQVALAASTVFLVALPITHILTTIAEVPAYWRQYIALMGIGLACTVTANALGLPFVAVTLPAMIGVACPLITTAMLVIVRRWRSITTSAKVFTVVALLYGLHVLDFSFLADKPSLQTLGFTLAVVSVFALAITVPAVVLETVTSAHARVAAELDVARRIQMELLPRNPRIPGLELACYMKPADEVGGDYYDVYTFGDRAWLLLGDVTGHGLSAGLVMLMAQSIISAILHTQKDISPSDLNVLANEILYQNLQRLNEDKQMTIVSICLKENHTFSLSGFHDNVFIHRHATGEVETLSVSQLPCGLGFLPEVARADVSDDSYRLEQNDLLVLITDGVTEAAREGDYAKGTFDESRLIEFIKESAGEPLERIKEKLNARLKEFTSGVFHDDVTFVIARRLVEA